MNWRLLNLASSAYEQKPEPPSLCDLIYSGRRHLLSGLPEANKTLFALILGLELLRSSGDTFAMIDFESGPEATRLMLTELGATKDELERVLYPEIEGPPDATDIGMLVDAGAKLAIIDAAIGAYDASGLDDNKRQDAEKFGLSWIDPLWQRGVATVLIDHVVKSAESRGKFAIGSERKAGRTDVHLGLEARLQLTRGTHGLVRVTVHKDRPGWLTRPHAADLDLQSDPETHAIRWEFKQADADQEPGHWRPTELMTKVSAYLEEQAEPVTRNTVEHAIKGTATYVRQAMTELVTAGHAEEIAGSRGSRLLRFLTPFPPTASDCVGTASATQSDSLATASSASALLTDDADAVDEAEIDRLDRVGQKLGLT